MTRPLRKLYPREQLLLEQVFGEDDLKAIRESQDDAAFRLVSEDLATEHRCPACGYEWNGNPKPPGAKA